MSNVLILGINGQDGILLSNFLRAKGKRLFGVGNQSNPSQHLPGEVKYYSYDIRNTEKITDLIKSQKIDHVYNLASQSSVAQSFLEPEKTHEINALAVRNLLTSIFHDEGNSDLRFFQASSSEMFGPTSTGMQSETTELNPKSPYAESKVEAHLLCNDFQSDGYKVYCGILFNHESIYRPTHFVTRKVTTAIARIKLGLQKELEIGNLEATRDWGSARDYVAAMHLILSSETPDDYVIATGKSHSVRDLISISLRHVDLEDSFEELVKVDTTLLRTGDVKKTIGDSRKIKNSLGWEATTSFSELIYEMIQHDLGLNTISY
jgi:GDPmannose 4,6-dehydratase